MITASALSARRLVFVLASFTLGTVVHAQAAARPVSVGLGVGGTVPLGDFAKDVKTGWHGLAYLQYQPPAGPWAVRGEVQYHRSDYTDDFLSDVGATLGQDLTNGVLYGGASALFMGNRQTGMMTPYLIGGLGLYRVTATLQDDSGFSQSTSENGFGFNGGAGVRFGGSMGFFLEARFHQFSITPELGPKSTSQMIPVSLGFSF